MYIKQSLFFLIVLFLSSCSSKSLQKEDYRNIESNKQPDSVVSTFPHFNSDSAFLYIKDQCSFGARVPNSKAHKDCADYLSSTLKRFGCEVQEQKFDAVAYDGTILSSNNIIGTFAPEKEKRIILFSHWDSRPFCDNDVEANWHKPVMGANDGASGVAVLLELMRLVQIQSPNVGLDIVFLDSEDYGTPSFSSSGSEDTWCLGSQYYGKNTHFTHKPVYGILLDMVGGRDANFYMDLVSLQYAKNTIEKIWTRAHSLGYAQRFHFKQGGAVLDDHYYINKLTGIPTIDIIDYTEERGFPLTWHTVYDTPENIDKTTLKMVGDVLVNVIYNE